MYKYGSLGVEAVYFLLQMGNCSLKGDAGECSRPIRILTDSGYIMQFKGPKRVHQVIENHPGYGVFQKGHASSSPLPIHQSLSGSNFYYLLPLAKNRSFFGCGSEVSSEKSFGGGSDLVEHLANGSDLEVLQSEGDGFWRVKLMIDTKKLEEILSEQANTEALIEKMRMAASLRAKTRRIKKERVYCINL